MQKVYLYIMIVNGKLYDFRVMNEEPCREFIVGLRKIFIDKHPNKPFKDFLFPNIMVEKDGELPTPKIPRKEYKNYIPY